MDLLIKYFTEANWVVQAENKYVNSIRIISEKAFGAKKTLFLLEFTCIPYKICKKIA